MKTKKYMSSVLKKKLRIIFFSSLSVTNSWVLYSPIFRQTFRKRMEEKMLDLWAYLEPNDIFFAYQVWKLPPLSDPFLEFGPSLSAHLMELAPTFRTTWVVFIPQLFSVHAHSLPSTSRSTHQACLLHMHCPAHSGPHLWQYIKL